MDEVLRVGVVHDDAVPSVLGLREGGTDDYIISNLEKAMGCDRGFCLLLAVKGKQKDS